MSRKKMKTRTNPKKEKYRALKTPDSEKGRYKPKVPELTPEQRKQKLWNERKINRFFRRRRR